MLGAQLSEAHCREPGEGPTAGQTAAQGGEDRAGQAAAQELMPPSRNFGRMPLDMSNWERTYLQLN
jgi:hypothetical protein